MPNQNAIITVKAIKKDDKGFLDKTTGRWFNLFQPTEQSRQIKKGQAVSIEYKESKSKDGNTFYNITKILSIDTKISQANTTEAGTQAGSQQQAQAHNEPGAGQTRLFAVEKEKLLSYGDEIMQMAGKIIAKNNPNMQIDTPEYIQLQCTLINVLHGKNTSVGISEQKMQITREINGKG